MSFTDDDLKRCKRLLAGEMAMQKHVLNNPEVQALIARLECAERVAERFAVLLPIAMEAEEIAKLSKIELDQRFYRVMIAKEDVEAWRKSKGEA